MYEVEESETQETLNFLKIAGAGAGAGGTSRGAAGAIPRNSAMNSLRMGLRILKAQPPPGNEDSITLTIVGKRLRYGQMSYDIDNKYQMYPIALTHVIAFYSKVCNHK